jgi:hypothetical protein
MSAASAEVPNVLIVEDEMMLGKDIVEDAGFRPVEALSAEACLSSSCRLNRSTQHRH